MSQSKGSEQAGSGSGSRERAKSADFVTKATLILQQMRTCLLELDRLDERRAGLAAAHLSEAIDGLQRALATVEKRDA
jgi:hypothetical protein